MSTGSGRGGASTAIALDPGLLAQLERVQLRTRRRLAGRFSGEHRSPAFGASIDFADYRDYQPGDDFRRIDYPLYARTGNLFIRLFEAEDDVTVRLLVDRSASMGLHGKLEQAVTMAAAIGFVALVHRDTVIVHTDPTLGAAAPPRFSGRHATAALFDLLGSITALGPTDLAGATRHVSSGRGTGVTVVLSDLLSDDWATAVDRCVARGGDTVVLHVLAREEVSPDERGDFDLVDVETGASVAASLSPQAMQTYRDSVERWLADAEAHCLRRGALYVRIMADEPPADVLLRTWRDQGLVR